VLSVNTHAAHSFLHSVFVATLLQTACFLLKALLAGKAGKPVGGSA
jgi:hypothetical protein